MLLKRFTDYILRSRSHAIGMAFVTAFLPLVGTVSVLIVAFITLLRGAREGFYVLVAATLPLVITIVYSPPVPTDSFNAINILACYIVTNVLTWLFAILLRKYGSWNLLIQLGALLGMIVVVGVYIVNPDIQSWWQSHLTNYFIQTMQAMDNMPADKVAMTKAALQDMVKSLAPFVTGFTAIFIIFYALLQLLLARWWQAAMYNPGGLRKELCNIRLSYAAGFVCLVGSLLLFTGNGIVLDMMPVLYVTFVVAGFSILHVLIGTGKRAWIWNSLIYVGILLVPFGLAVIALLAILDTFFDLRRRLPHKPI